ncbi:MAG: type II toxin-antitoxin system PemK/MazF family toxin [Planctomycetaceae bacterium]
MAITFHPGYGTMLYGSFDHQEEPEMVKSRPVVVLSRKNSNIRLCTVVPLSGTEPVPLQKWHHKMTFNKLPKQLQTNDWWAKCDCIASVAFFRLDRIRSGRNPNTGKREYVAPTVYGKDLEAIKLAVLNHLGMSDLILPRT